MVNIMASYDLTLINPPALIERPPVEQSGTLFVPEKLRITAMNPGILSLFTYLKSKGFSVNILDLSLDTEYSSMEKKIKNIDSRYVGISSTSGFDYLESLKIAEFTKTHTNAQIFIGGQHAGPLGELVLMDSQNIDAVIKFEGELVLEQILKSNTDNKFKIPGVVYKENNKIITVPGKSPKIKLNDLPFLDYSSYPNYLKFVPFIEESRGCVYGCNFCTSNTINHRRIDMKSPKRFLDETDYCVSLFGKEKAYAVLASTYGVNPKFGKEIALGMKKFGIKWNSEFRADSEWEEFIYELLDSGYEVVNIGLESGSPDILKLMGKTKNPYLYLGKMRKLAKIVSKSSAVMRSNFMFYIGETPKTIQETIKFISQTPEIHSVQFSPLIVFNNTPVFNNFAKYREEYGCDIINTEYWQRRHFYPVHPSKYFSFDEVATLGHVLEKIFSKEDAWIEAAKSLYSQENKEVVKKIKETLRESRFRRSK